MDTMNLFRPWLRSVDSDPSSLVGGPAMSLALALPPNHPALSGFSGSTGPSSGSGRNSCPKKNSSANGTIACKSFLSYYQYYYNQLIYASMQQQLQQSSSAPISSKVANCRSLSPPSPSGSRRVAKAINTRNDNNNNHNNANKSAETNERPQLRQEDHEVAQANTNRSQTESQWLNSSRTTNKNLSSGTNKRACEMGNQSSNTLLLRRTGANMSSSKRPTSTESQATLNSLSVNPDCWSNRLPQTPANTPSRRPPDLVDLQNILSFQNMNMFVDSLAAKKRAAKAAAEQRPKKFICTECKSGFSNRSQLNSHIRTHTGERPFVCDYKNCQKSFTRNEELTRHRRIHSGIRPYPCRWCDKRFGRKDHLRKHERTHERRLRSTILLNYTANLTHGQLLGGSALHTGPLNHSIGSNGSPSSCSSSSSGDLLAKVQASALGFPSKLGSTHAAFSSNSISSTNLCLPREKAVAMTPKLCT